ncbi:MAG: hypothetical protein KF819_10735 [Labilithrix sp.]|nr:hypothetical protein [Labilithrix sp.]
MSARPLLLFVLFGALAVAPVGCAAPIEEEAAEAEGAITADTTLVDADASGVARAQVNGITMTFDAAARIDVANGRRVLVVPGRVSRNVDAMRSFVPDDAFGEVRMRGPRSFDLVLRGDHEINTVLSGLPLWLSIETSSGAIRRYEAAVHLGARLHGFAGPTSIRIGDVRPVSAGNAGDALRYRLDVTTTKTYPTLTVAGAEPRRLSARKWLFDWTYGGVAPVLEQRSFAVSASPSETTTSKVEIRVKKLGLTTKTAESQWTATCEASVRRCIARAADLGECGSYRQVSTCQNEEPPPDPGTASIERKVAADILAKTGRRYAASVLTTRTEAGKTIALIALPRGGSAEWIVAPTVSLSKLVSRPEFKDTWQVARFEGQLRSQHGMPGATIVAHGTPAGGAPRWHFVVDRAGARSTVALEATSATTSNVIPYVYDEAAFRGLAGHLVVDRALAVAAQAGPYAELEVYLSTSAMLAVANGMELVAPADSPVGFDPATEVQLAAYSVWGDLAFFVTVARATGATRVDSFN